MYDWLEDDIVSRLAPLTEGPVTVVALPDSQADYERKATGALVTVAVTDDEATGQIRDAGRVVQDGLVTIDVIVQSNLRRGDNMVNSVARAVRLLLIGYHPTNCDRKIWFQSGRLLPSEDDKKGTYTYHLKLHTMVPVIEDFDEEILAEALTEIVVNSEFGESVTIDDELDGGDSSELGYDIEFDGGLS